LIEETKFLNAPATPPKMLMLPTEYRLMFELEDHYWWYVGIRDLLNTLLEKYAPRGNQNLILDAGCGTGANLLELDRYGNTVGIDLSAQAIAYCRARGIARERAWLASAMHLPFRAAQFDLAISFDVICNVTDDARAMAEIARALKPGAPFLVLMPAYQWLWSAHDVAVGTLRRYSRGELRARLEHAGFAIERMSYVNCFLFPIVLAVRMARRSEAHNGAVTQSDLAALPRPLNALLSWIYQLEMKWLARANLPFGASLIAVARKK